MWSLSNIFILEEHSQLKSSHAQLEGFLKEAHSSQGRLEAELEELKKEDCSNFEASSELEEAEKQVDLLQEQLEEQQKLEEK